MINTNTNYDQADDNARQIISRTKRVTRRQFSPEETLRIVIEGIRVENTITALCRTGRGCRSLKLSCNKPNWRGARAEGRPPDLG